MLWPDQKITCLVESTTYCNSKCPQCSRTNPNGLGFSGICELKHVTLEEWIEGYAKSYDGIESFHFSGQWGDCFMNPEIEDIFDHIKENSDCTISFSTNGSLREPDFFWRIGVKNRGRISGTFDVDGWTQENHQLYRVNTDLEKIKENAEAFAESGNTTKIFTVVFKHNQDDIEDISNWAKSIGAGHEAMQSNRFWNGTKSTYTYQGVEYTLEQTTDTDISNKFINKNSRIVRDHRHKNIERTGIECSWGLESKVYVDEHLNVWPCCYWHIRGSKNPEWAGSNLFHNFVEEIKSGEYNLKKYTLKEILEKRFYKKDLENSFSIEPSWMCTRVCGILKDQ